MPMRYPSTKAILPILAGCLLAGSSAEGSIQEASAERPHLLITREEHAGLRSLEQLRATIQRGDPAKRWKEILAEAERDLEREPYTPFSVVANRSLESARRGDRDWILVHETGRRIVRAALVRLVTGEQRFARSALTQMETVFDRSTWKEWRTVAHIDAYPDHEADLRTGMLALDIGLAYDWLHDALAEEERQRVLRGLDDRAIQPYLRTIAKKPWWLDADSNWMTVVVGGLGVCGMALGDDHPDSARLIEIALPRMRRYLDAYGPEGEFNESPPYANSSMRPALFFTARRYHQLRASPSPELKSLQRHGHWLMYLVGPPGRTAGFGDGHPDYPPITAPIPGIVAATRDTALQWYYQQYAQDSKFPMLELLLYDDTVEAKPPDPERFPLGRYFPAHDGIVSSRDAWRPAETTCVVYGKSGDPSVRHSQADPGTLIVDGFHERLIVDLGSVPYPKWSERPHYYHFNEHGQNLVTFADHPIEWNRSVERRAQMLFTRLDDALGAAWVVDTGALYPGVASLRRGVVHLLPRVIAVYDVAEVDEEDEIRLRWHTATEADARDDGSFSFEKGAATLIGRLIELEHGGELGVGRHEYRAPYDRSRTGVPLPQRREPFLDSKVRGQKARFVTLMAIFGPEEKTSSWKTNGESSWTIPTSSGRVEVRIEGMKMTARYLGDPKRSLTVDLE